MLKEQCAILRPCLSIHYLNFELNSQSLLADQTLDSLALLADIVDVLLCHLFRTHHQLCALLFTFFYLLFELLNGCFLLAKLAVIYFHLVLLLDIFRRLLSSGLDLL